jgi:hypothetical protein
MREKLGSFANLHAAEINTNRLMEKKLSLMNYAVSCLLTSCICLSCEFVSLSHSVHPMCSVSYPLSHYVSHVTLVSANLSHAVSYACLSVVSCLTCLCELFPVSHDLVSCLSNSAMNLLVSYVLKIVSYLTWTALG